MNLRRSLAIAMLILSSLVPSAVSLAAAPDAANDAIDGSLRLRFNRLLEPIESMLSAEQRASIETLIGILEAAEREALLAYQASPTAGFQDSFAAAVEGCTADYSCGGSSTDSHDTTTYVSEYLVWGDEVDQTACADVVNMQNVVVGDNNWVCVNIFHDNRFNCSAGSEGGRAEHGTATDDPDYNGRCEPKPGGNATLAKAPR